MSAPTIASTARQLHLARAARVAGEAFGFSEADEERALDHSYRKLLAGLAIAMVAIAAAAALASL